jgi:nucleoside-diphosphate-sugar epimerase/glycosyltransferase involved in cell wall biosynthesis
MGPMRVFDKARIRVLHAAVSMTPSAGVVKQMEWEQQAADALSLPWRVVLHTPYSIESSIVHTWTELPSSLYARYFGLRKRFYDWLIEVEKDYDLIILRHSVHDVFEARLAAQLGHKLLTMHHTLELSELRAHGVWGPARGALEAWIGTAVIKRSLGTVAVTHEILEHEQTREETSAVRPGFVYPNGVWLSTDVPVDLRGDTPELLFVASYFSAWHGFDLLIDAVARSSQDCRIHIVGSMGEEDARRCELDKRFVVHGPLGASDLKRLMAHAWCGLSSFSLGRKGMREACSLKVREYLDAGVAVYAGHQDIGLPEDFAYFRYGTADIDEIVSFAKRMRDVSRAEVISAASPLISKTILLDRFYQELQQQLAPQLLGAVIEPDRNEIVSLRRECPGLVALTGASGFIGKVLLAQLLAAGWKVRVLTREPHKWEASDSLDVFAGDLLETRDWSRFLAGVDVVVHAAAEIRRSHLMDAVNVQGPERLLRAALAAGVRRWVQLSSVGAYGPSVSGWVTEHTPEHPVGPYEKTKTLFDHLLREMSKQTHLQVCIVRPSNVYGPEMVNQSLFQMMRMVRRGWFAYLGPTGASANYVHVNDVASALLLCVESPQAAGQTYNVSDWTTLENMVQAMAKGMNVSAPTRRLSLGMTLLVARCLQWIPRWPLTVGRVRAMSSRVRYSTEAITKELGWHVSMPVVRGMQELASRDRISAKSAATNLNRSLRRVLIITYDWPPRNSIATHRPYSWARYWAAQGVDVTVLTATKKFFDLPLDLDLPTLDGVHVREVDYTALIPISNSAQSELAPLLTNMLKKVKSMVSYVLGWEYDVRSNWAAGAKRMVDEIGTNFDVVISTYGPDSAHKIASKFKRANPAIYWVADYRDLWSLNTRNRSSELIKALARRKELEVVKSADLFTTVSDELAQALSELVRKPPEVIFNGFDIALDPDLYKRQLQIKGGQLHVVYTGRIYSGKRNPAALVRAIERLIDEKSIDVGEVCLDFYGVNTQMIDEEFQPLKYPEIIKHHGHVTRSLALGFQQSADLLLLLESGDEDSKGFLTGKIFEYIGAGRPIISIGSKSDSAIARVLNETRCGACYENDVNAIAKDLLAYLRGTPPAWFKPDLDAIKRYSRKYQADLLLECMKEHMQVDSLNMEETL